MADIGTITWLSVNHRSVPVKYEQEKAESWVFGLKTDIVGLQ